MWHLATLTDYYLWIDHWRGTPPKFEAQCQVNCVEPWIHSGLNHKIYCKDDIYKIKIRHFPQSTGFENSLLIDYFLEDLWSVAWKYIMKKFRSHKFGAYIDLLWSISAEPSDKGWIILEHSVFWQDEMYRESTNIGHTVYFTKRTGHLIMPFLHWEYCFVCLLCSESEKIR